MKLDSKYFDRIRVKPEEDRRLRDHHPDCEWPGCDRPAPHRAPKGRRAEGEYFRFCIDHVRQYNKAYNFFDGMPDDAVGDWIRSSATGHRPTWKLGENSWAENRRSRDQRGKGGGRRGRGFQHDETIADPHRMFDDHARGPHQPGTAARQVRNAERKALDTLGLDAGADAAAIKAQYKTLVKRFHPDANGGSREMEDRLREIIQAYDYLRSAGMC